MFGWILALVITVALFYWKILFTKQFSILWGWEPVVQSYSWYQFAAASIQQGLFPIWDPYRFSGNTFIGEMQTGLFYPLKLFAYFMPFDESGLLSERVYNQVYVAAHLLAAVFMFLLARHLRLSPFSAFVAGVCFGLGGFVGRTVHSHLLDSAIWLPLIVLFFLRSTEEETVPKSVFFAALGGLCLGTAVLGGGVHMVIMQGIVIGTMSLTLCFAGKRRRRVLGIGAMVAFVGFSAGAVQLIPSMEYAPLAYRWVGGDAPIQGLQNVPYIYLGDLARFSPRSLFAFLAGGVDSGNHEFSNYFGVIPLFAAILGAWQYWGAKWVKYFVALAVISFLYSWGSFSFLHGVLYLLPGLDIAREAGRFVYLTHFAMAILAGYGIEYLFGALRTVNDPMRVFLRAVRWLVVFLAAFLLAGSLQDTIAINPWAYVSFFFIGSTCAVLELAQRNYRAAPAKVLLVFLLVWDLYSFNWIVRNKQEAQAANQDEMAELRERRELAEFLRSDGSLFRIHFDAENAPNLGNTYGVQMTGGMSATMLVDYARHFLHPRMAELLNVRYIVRRSAADSSGDEAVFSDGVWNVYETPRYGERAWVVQRIEVDASEDRLLRRLEDPAFDPSRVAIAEHPIREAIDTAAEPLENRVQNTRYEPAGMEFRVTTSGGGLLVISEVFYPGWQAFVNETPAPIHRVNGFLRGVAVPDGESAVRLEYRPLSVRAGAVVSLLTLVGTAVLGLFVLRKRN